VVVIPWLMIFFVKSSNVMASSLGHATVAVEIAKPALLVLVCPAVAVEVNPIDLIAIHVSTNSTIDLVEWNSTMLEFVRPILAEVAVVVASLASLSEVAAVNSKLILVEVVLICSN
jgi:hypothetical protein